MSLTISSTGSPLTPSGRSFSWSTWMEITKLKGLWRIGILGEPRCQDCRALFRLSQKLLRYLQQRRPML